MKLPTLFSTDSKGRARMWEVETDGATIYVTHGLVDGKKQTKPSAAKGKNIGRANETTPEEQAELEAKAKWIKQIEREDYAEDIEKADKQLRPMLAHNFHNVPHRVRWDMVCTQPKLDGLRLTGGLRWTDRDCPFEKMTRKGENYHIPHLVDDVKMLRGITNGLLDREWGGQIACQATDGEVYIHGMDLPKITSLARRYQPGETEELEYHVFDLVIPGMSYEQRYGYLQEAITALYTVERGKSIVLVPVDHVSSQEEMEAMHKKYVANGFEGAILRHWDGHYKVGRSPDLFKYKMWKDEECLITGMWIDENGNAMLTCKRRPTLKFGANVVLDVTPKRTHKVRKKMLLEQDKWIGQWITVRYQEVTPKGSLQFPRGMALRECDENGEPIV